ncbi:DUF6576 domain-containing protein [Kordia algicida OT-1]|uniref:DUF6576 domain-containing protein n=1 Tax=Kordia algicida OT-1 TaxID=391587 RepID=A9E6C1_9FLAO|nr:DUF6576 domain-containing protein [Kordia algicida]EDP95008.1 hypothetical protein KAOT1_01694 [Kordia algicida OT-1]
MSLMPFISIAVIAVFVYVVFFAGKNNSGLSKRSGKKYYTIDDEFNAKKKEKQEKVDRILEKINAKGVESLTSQEKAILDEYSSSN